MKKNNYSFIFLYFFLLFFLNGCSLLKDKKENKSDVNTRQLFVNTVAKPDPSLRGLKVSLPKPITNKTWNQITNNEAHRVIHPYVGKKIKLLWKTSIGKGQNKKRPISTIPVIDKENIYTIDTNLTVTAINLNLKA